jgi:predicted glycogen debranching enzyme
MTRRLVDTVARKLPLPSEEEGRAQRMIDTEWIVTNGLGGYSSSSVSGSNTRRYHGVLVAALPNPLGRMIMVSGLHESIAGASGTRTSIDRENAGRFVRAFRLEIGLPVWELAADGVVVEKRLWMPHGQNTTIVQYRLLEGTSASLEIRPGLHFRGYEASVDSTPPTRYDVEARNGFVYVAGVKELPRVHMHIEKGMGDFIAEDRSFAALDYPVEIARGFPARGDVWSPGYFRAELRSGATMALIMSTEREDEIAALPSGDARACERERRRRLARTADARVQDPVGLELVMAADQFIITPAGRLADATRAKAMGDEIRTVIAGYHWFTDWGRDTMISLEGLTLTTGRYREAAFILRTFAHYVKDGLIPNMFPDGSNQGLYHTADATLWFFHALERYLVATRDEDMLIELLPVMQDIIDKHEQGTRFGIRMDPKDSLLTQGEEGISSPGWMPRSMAGW